MPAFYGCFCWLTGNLPLDHEMYYGLTRFAIELNELREEESAYLPITDTRFRPDQRYLSIIYYYYYSILLQEDQFHLNLIFMNFLFTGYKFCLALNRCEFLNRG